MTSEPTTRLDPDRALAPFLKWPGGKSDELRAIAAATPALTGRYLDPFVGGGSVLLAVPPGVPAAVNDTCPELIALYRGGAVGDRTLQAELTALADAWAALAGPAELHAGLREAFAAGRASAVAAALGAHGSALDRIAGLVGLPGDRFPGRVERELLRKFDRMAAVERLAGRRLSDVDLEANVEGSIRSTFYGAVRARYNAARLAGRLDATRAADFLFLREFAYAAMFRFNTRGGFNVPYGGVSYNRKPFGEKVGRLFGEPMRARLANTTFASQDAMAFLAAVAPGPEDFVFVDPPYDSVFSDYDGRAFGPDDQRRLRDALLALRSRVMVVIKATETIRALYPSDRWHVLETAKSYPWTIKSRNDRSARHLTITNYDPLDAA